MNMRKQFTLTLICLLWALVAVAQPANDQGPWQHRACPIAAVPIAVPSMTLRYHTPLTPAEQIAFGLKTPRPLAMADKVRFAELDILNHVNNKSYMGWFESLRVAHFDHFCAPLFRNLPSPFPATVQTVILRSYEYINFSSSIIKASRLG